MVGFKTQRICIKCCFRLGKTESKTEEILKATSAKVMWENMTLFGGFSTQHGKTSVKYCKHPGGLSVGRTNENVVEVRKIINES